MTTIVCDASVLVKLLVSEPDSSLALALAVNYSIILPDLPTSRSPIRLWSRVHDGSSYPDQATRLIEEFEGFNFDIHSIDSQNRRAIELAIRLDHPIYDCVYVALAENLKIPLVTADRRFLTAWRRGGLSSANIKSLAEFA